jgi:hypothetical protein
MNISESLQALQSINAYFNRLPSRIFNSFQNPESGEGLEQVLTDMMMDQHSFTANVKTVKTMTTVENILLDQLRKE